MERSGWENARLYGRRLATEDSEFTESFFLLPSTKQHPPAFQPGCFQMGKVLRLGVLGDRCGRTVLTSGRPKRKRRNKIGISIEV
jgi:hypothetical protein